MTGTFVARRVIAAVALIAAPLSAAQAGPPFATDDPEPTEYGHYEIYLYSQGTWNGDSQAGTAVGVEVNYGALPNVQISAALPVGFNAPDEAGPRFGIADAKFGVKYRFIQEDGDGWQPQVSFYPSVEAALGNSSATGSDHAAHVFLPLWAQESFGSWTTFGGGGYRINGGRDGRDSWFAGWALVKRLDDRFQLGAELFRETAATRNSNDNAGVSIGAIYDLSEEFHLMGSAGASVEDNSAASAVSFYVALEWTM